MTGMAPSAGIAYIGDENSAEWARSNHREVAMPIGERIKTLRSEQRWSQGDLATRIGADPARSAAMRTATSPPRPTPSSGWPKPSTCRCDYLLVDDAPRRPFRSPIEDALGDNLAAIAELGDDDLHSVQNFVDALITRARLKTLAGGSA